MSVNFIKIVSKSTNMTQDPLSVMCEELIY